MKTLVENIVPILLGLLVSGIGATIKMMIATRRDVKELLKINFLQTANIGAITSCAELHLKATRSTAYSVGEVLRDDQVTAKESINKAQEFTNKAEDILTCQRDANTRAAMAVGGR
jgi:hypothetical protein